MAHVQSISDLDENVVIREVQTVMLRESKGSVMMSITDAIREAGLERGRRHGITDPADTVRTNLCAPEPTPTDNTD